MMFSNVIAVFDLVYCSIQDQMLRLQASYIGETGRNLNIRLTEHKRVTKNGDVNNHIAETLYT